MATSVIDGVKFDDLSAADMIHLHTILKRADRVWSKQGQVLDRLSLQMDLIATHSNGNPLDFEKLAAFDDFNFTHDVVGIYNKINRETGKLRDLFVPRCSTAI